MMELWWWTGLIVRRSVGEGKGQEPPAACPELLAVPKFYFRLMACTRPVVFPIPSAM